MERFGVVTIPGEEGVPVRFSVRGRSQEGEIGPPAGRGNDILVRLLASDERALLEENETGWKAEIHVFELPSVTAMRAPMSIQEVIAEGTRRKP